MNEDSLKEEVLKCLNSDFIIREEVEGCHIVTGEKVRIDFLIYPREHLIEQKFERIWIGIEVKAPKTQKDGTRLAWQAITYKQSIFDENISPAFVLTYPNIIEFYDVLKVLNEINGRHFEYREGRIVAQLLQKANVGFLHLGKNGHWSLKFASQQYYYDSRKGKGQIINLGVTKHVGSTKRT